MGVLEQLTACMGTLKIVLPGKTVITTKYTVHNKIMRNEMHAHTNCTTVVKIFSYVKLAYMLSIQPVKYIFCNKYLRDMQWPGLYGCLYNPWTGVCMEWNSAWNGKWNGIVNVHV